MAKEVVTLAFIFAILFSVLSPTIEAIKAEIVEKSDLMPLSDGGETNLPTNVAPYRRYGPLIEQSIFSIRDAPSKTYMGTNSCDKCDALCKYFGYDYGKCDEDGTCFCYNS